MKTTFVWALCFFLMTSVFPAGNKANGAQNQKAFNKALSTYEKMHDAFFKIDLKKAKELVPDLKAQIKEIKGDAISKKLSPAKEGLDQLIKAKNVEEGHKGFHKISLSFLALLDSELSNKVYARYYCPMVKKYWIQNVSESEKVMNPYASDTMPHCGGKME